MAFALVGTIGANLSTANNQASLIITTSALAAAGSLVVVAVAVDNIETVDGDSSAVSSIVDSAGNSYAKAKSFVNGQGAAQSGAAVEIWFKVLGAQLPSGGTITITFSNAALADASAARAMNYSIGSGHGVVVEATNTRADDATTAGALDCTTSNVECLRFRAIASESSSTTTITATSGWTALTQQISGAGTSATEIGLRGEFRISTGTSGNSAPTGGASGADHASVYVAFKETISGTGGTISATATLTGTGQKVASGTGSTIALSAATLSSAGRKLAFATGGTITATATLTETGQKAGEVHAGSGGTIVATAALSSVGRKSALGTGGNLSLSAATLSSAGRKIASGASTITMIAAVLSSVGRKIASGISTIALSAAVLSSVGRKSAFGTAAIVGAAVLSSAGRKIVAGTGSSLTVAAAWSSTGRKFATGIGATVILTGSWSAGGSKEGFGFSEFANASAMTGEGNSFQEPRRIPIHGGSVHMTGTSRATSVRKTVFVVGHNHSSGPIRNKPK